VKHITLREARKRRGLTQEELEARSGVSQAVISSIERGIVQDPASSTVLKLADALDVDPRVFRFGVEAEIAS
jgi:transcriptional regulator with XRE-family HTH domain